MATEMTLRILIGNSVECNGTEAATEKILLRLQGWGRQQTLQNLAPISSVTRPGKDRSESCTSALHTKGRPQSGRRTRREIKAQQDADTIGLCVDPKESWSRLGVCCQEEKRRRGLYRIGRAHSVRPRIDAITPRLWVGRKALHRNVLPNPP